MQRQIEAYHTQSAGRSSSADAAPGSELGFASDVTTQLKMVTQRAFQHYWRSPPYVMAKLMLNIVAGLFIGFSFYKSPNDVAGLQNKVSPDDQF